ncbi:hypothetical protein CA54_19460 [Symmachiella macrocystis]|uniref:Cytochrome C n=1 Tax=Symmachiella macrocystis TaxID=2527985 RepID=A0A5C6BLW4_9PLAN|nr:hypothetical protein [Symmachiella macrocystis]TWU13120.1 hypothetical protein CA54_19460 [Symmachiella macrocystis]
MTLKNQVRGGGVFVAGLTVGLLGAGLLGHATWAAGEDVGESPAALRAELDMIKGKLPGQAHAMMDVAYHYDNLWFAGQHGNWPLAQFYFNETRSHLRWAVRIIPVRKDNQGQEVKLADILKSLENRPLKDLESAIQAGDREKFNTAYRFTLEACYACHKAADKPYLTLQVPDHPAESMIDFEPVVK